MEPVGQLTARINELAAAIREAPPSAALRGVYATLRLDEIVGSTRLAGAALDAAEIRALLQRGRALGGHPVDDYLLVRGYADAATWAAREAVRPRPLSLDDLRMLHRLAVRGLRDDGGAWRTRNLSPLADGTVPPPHWMVPFETETAIGRLALEEQEPPSLALAHAIARLTRLRPFATANGRVARLVATFLALRRGLPPPALDARARTAYVTALRAADARDIAPLALVIGRALVRALERVYDAIETPEALAPLASFASGAGAALYKAAQRGRLRVVRRNGRLYTTQPWVDAYRSHPPSR